MRKTSTLLMAGSLAALGVLALGGGFTNLFLPTDTALAAPPVEAPPWWRWSEADSAAGATETGGTRRSTRGLGWQLVDHVSTPGILIAKVETYRMDIATDIAWELVEPLAKHHSEILVYFHYPRAPLAVKRVQWRPESGFVELELGAAPATSSKGSWCSTRSTGRTWPSVLGCQSSLR